MESFIQTQDFMELFSRPTLTLEGEDNANVCGTLRGTDTRRRSQSRRPIRIRKLGVALRQSR